MAVTSVQEKQLSVQAVLNYVIPTEEPLYNYYLTAPPDGKPASNEIAEPHWVSIASLRDTNEPFRLDVQGFELVSFTPSVKDIYDPVELNTVFNAEVADLVKRHTGAAEVRVFSPFLRGEEAQRRMPGSITAPAGMIHVDYTHESGPSRFAQVFGADAERFRGRRFAIINVWRPITGPMQDHPLAICDARTVAPDDLLPSKTFSLVDEHGLHSAEGHVEEACVYSVAFDPAHRWYYVRDMMPHEALLLKNYDSELSGVSRFSPHTAFADPTTPVNALPRASIEVRSIAVW